MVKLEEPNENGTCEEVHKLEKPNLKDPEDFWSTVKELGRKKKEIPTEVYGEEGEILCDLEDVLQKRMTEIGLLFAHPPRGN